MMKTTTLGILIGLVAVVSCKVLISGDGKSKLYLEIVKKDGLLFQLTVGNETKLSGHIGRTLNISQDDCYDRSCYFSGSNSTILSIYAFFDSFQVDWDTYGDQDTIVLKDCLNLNSSNLSWYGGPEVWETSWPIEKLTLKNRPYISSKLENGAVLEPYWLNSKGGFILVDSDVPLFVDQNNEYKDSVCFEAANKLPFNKTYNSLTYRLAAKNNSREAHLSAVNNYLGKPSGLPDIRMVQEPIWTTWGKYKANINDNTVVEFLKNIYYHNFTEGQIEIDDKWEVCYGDQTFDIKTRFPNISKTVKTIHDHGFRATLWTHPFVNTECKTPVKEGLMNGYFVNSTSGKGVTSWWNGNSSYIIDFTNTNASNWFKNRLLKIRDQYGIDSFKCDAGENDWIPQKPIFHKQYKDAPNAYTRMYLNACSELGGLVEVRSGYRTQNLKVYVRMLDKDSVWGTNNGLKSLVHTLLQFNMIGYTFVLPDLIGGNGYKEIPTPEILVRWTQANAFMPSMQFSYLPWELKKVSFNTTEIVRKFVNLHKQYSDVLIEAMTNSTIYGVPVNPPIWWLDPTDPTALKVDDEFLVGQKILVAPILEEGRTSRNVYLPKGRWRDGNNSTIYAGERTLKNYQAPIDVLPYFFRL